MSPECRSLAATAILALLIPWTTPAIAGESEPAVSATPGVWQVEPQEWRRPIPSTSAACTREISLGGLFDYMKELACQALRESGLDICNLPAL